MLRFISFNQGVRSAKIRRPRISGGARVDDAHASNLPIERPVGMANQD